MGNTETCAYHVDYTGHHGYEFHTAEGIVWFSGATWARNSEHVVLSTATDGSEVGYVNHTECFGGTFTGI